MAPTKKKKKAASNPARGFATTSVASKQQLQDAELAADVQEGCEDELHSAVPDHVKGSATVVECKSPERELKDLNPEELEFELEESELQLAVEKHGERILKDAVRTANRLETERRLQRAQSTELALSDQLSSHIVELVHDQMRGHLLPLDNDIVAEKNDVYVSAEDPLLLCLWRVHMTLTKLHVAPLDSMATIEYYLKSPHGDNRDLPVVSKDGLQELESCLDWLAFSGAQDGSLDYENRKPDFPAVDLEESPSYEFLLQMQKTSSPRKQIQDSALNDTAADMLSSQAELYADSSDDSSDFDTGHMIEKYLSYKLALYDVSPSLAPGPSYKKRRQKAAEVLPQVDLAPREQGRVQRIQAKLAKIQADMLFDQETADAQWSALRLQREIDKASNEIDKATTHGSDSTADIADLRTNNAISGQETSFGIAGLLDVLEAPQEATFETIKKVNGGNEADLDMEVRVFQTWTGLEPRRVLEEACKARDNSSRITIIRISVSEIACRHALTIDWSRKQEYIASPPVQSIVWGNFPRRTRIEMRSVSCPNFQQSEAYISTVTLFMLFAQSPKEEKVALRLPPVWRDLWNELLSLSREMADRVSRQVLRDLRRLISVARASSTPAKAHEDLAQAQDGHDELSLEKSPTNSAVMNDGHPQQEWNQRSSTSSFQKMLASRKDLPIYQYKTDILEAIEQNQVIIICGQTGCGKSTQVPTYIIESEMSNNRYCKVYCAEPRRISAISLARRVSEELGERKANIGTNKSVVGYAIRLESKVASSTRLVFATTGIVMRMLEHSPELAGITHLLLDEVHERSIDSDFLLIVLKKLLVRRPSLKIVLMSATVDADKFSKYLDQAPVLEVPGRTFPVNDMYLEDAVEFSGFSMNDAGSSNIDLDEPEEDDIGGDSSKGRTTGFSDLKNYHPRTVQTLSLMDEYKIPYELIVRLLTSLQSGKLARFSQAVLVFLPGIAEIRLLNDMLLNHRLLGTRCEVYALHSTIATEDQEKAFLVPPAGVRKIVLATNIAETGITIPDITCVIDTGKHREMRFDERRQLSRLIESFISQANAMQRRGRAGRVQEGLCFHLFTKTRFQQLAREQTPEMLRLSLQDLVLRVKICKLGDVEETLSAALDPPSVKNIRRAVDALKDVRALDVNTNLTALGRQLARLPLDVFLGKLLILGSIFGCLDASLTIGAVLSSKSPFVASMGSRSQVDTARTAFARGDSDLLTMYNAYSAWKRVCVNNASSEQQFCRKNCLSRQTLMNIEDLKAQLFTAIQAANLIAPLPTEEKVGIAHHYQQSRRKFVAVPKHNNHNNDNDLVINSIIAMSFYPRLLRRDGKGWRSVATNQTVSIHPSSINRSTQKHTKWLSFHHIVAANNRFYNAHDTSPVSDMAVALLCGDADFKMYAGVLVIDSNRMRFSMRDWNAMLALKTLRNELRMIVEQRVLYPDRTPSSQQNSYMELFQTSFSQPQRP